MVNDRVDTAIKRARSGVGDERDFECLHEYLKSPDENHDRIYQAVTNYLKHAKIVDWGIAANYVNYPEDPLVSATTISMASIGACPDKSFWNWVLEIAKGVDWDSENDARVQALLALSRMPGGCAEARDIIRSSLLSDWNSVRDSAAIAAQRCFGRKESDVVIVGSSGRLIESVGTEVLNWIWPDRDIS